MSHTRSGKPHPRVNNGSASNQQLDHGIAQTLAIMAGLPQSMFMVAATAPAKQVTLSWSVVTDKSAVPEAKKISAADWAEMQQEAKDACQELKEALSHNAEFQLVDDGKGPITAAVKTSKLIGTLNSLRETYNVDPLSFSSERER